VYYVCVRERERVTEFVCVLYGERVREREKGVQLDHQSRASDKRKGDEGNHGTILKEKKNISNFFITLKEESFIKCSHSPFQGKKGV